MLSVLASGQWLNGDFYLEMTTKEGYFKFLLDIFIYLREQIKGIRWILELDGVRDF